MNQRTIYLVRHAKAMDRDEWHGEDEERPLTSKGYRQAQVLAEALYHTSPQAVLSSPARRCRDTVAPLAARTKRVTLQVVPFLAEGSDPTEALRALVTWQVGTHAKDSREPTEDEGPFPSLVACSHGDVIGGVLSILAHSKVIKPDQVMSAKGSLWVFRIRDIEVIEAIYVEEPGPALSQSVF